MARVPILEVDGVLIASVQDDLRDADTVALEEELGQRIERSGASGVLIDLSVVETVDSFLGRAIHDIASGARLLGARTIVVGIRPAVAVTLVELGLQLNGVRTALTARHGMALLRAAAPDRDGRG